MSEERPSSTAIGAALLRAAHRLVDRAPLLLDDALALPLSGLPGEAAVHGALGRLHGEFSVHGGAAFAQELVGHLRSSILLRNRYAEDELERAMGRGVGQYVMLGAGLDSFALRRPELAARLQVFELDLPATQRWKQARLAQLRLELPASLHFIPVDFERQTPLQALAGSSFRQDRPAFFSWLGVTGYLAEQAVYATLQDIAAMAAGSEIVFSYGLRDSLIAGSGRRINDALKAGIAARNEPAANSGFDPRELSARLRELGYASLQELTVAEADACYFDGRGDGLRAPPMMQMMKAGIAVPG